MKKLIKNGMIATDTEVFEGDILIDREKIIEIGSGLSAEDAIKIYDLEMTICDIIRDRNKLDLQIFNTAINEYMKRKDKNLIRLAEYAKKFNIEKILKQYMEVLG